VDFLHLGCNGAVHGDSVCRSIRIDPGASIIGKLQISTQTAITSEYEENKSIIEGDVEDEPDGFAIEDGDDPNLMDDENNDNEGSGSNSNSVANSPKKARTVELVEPPPPRRDYKVVLFIMEPQVDFYPGGKCYHHHGHGGQHEEHFSDSSDQFAENLAEFIQGHMEDIDEIVISLDSHNVSELHSLLKA
jgi:hypothetical protein